MCTKKNTFFLPVKQLLNSCSRGMFYFLFLNVCYYAASRCCCPCFSIPPPSPPPSSRMISSVEKEENPLSSRHSFSGRPNQQRIGEVSVFRDYVQERAHFPPILNKFIYYLNKISEFCPQNCWQNLGKISEPWSSDILLR